MKILIAIVLSICVAAFAFASTVDKAAIEEALAKYEAGLELTKAQDALVSEYGPVGGNVIDNAGGPDAFGYTWHDSEEPDGPTFNWYDITGTGTSFIANMSDDNQWGPVPIGFSFPFYGTTFTDVYIGSNGCLNFDNAYMSLANGVLPGTHGAQIAIFNDDLDPVGGLADAYYETFDDGTQNVFVISCINWYEYPDGGFAITMQYQLYEDGTIQFHYQTVDQGFDIANSTIGIQDPTRTIGLMALYDGSIPAYPYDGLAIEFNTDTEPDADLSGTVTDFDTGLPMDGVEVTVSGNTATTGPDGIYTLTGFYPVTVFVTAEAEGYFDYGPVAVGLVSGDNTHDFEMATTPDLSFFYDFEAGPEPFTTDGAVWEYGTPTVEPNGSYSGEYSWSVALNSDYDNNQNEWLISEPFLVETPAAMMIYQAWYDYETFFDGYNINVSTDGGTNWEVVHPEGGYNDDSVWGLDGEPGFTGHDFASWNEVIVLLGDYMDQEIMIAFRHGTDASVASYPGVTIDDVALYIGTAFQSDLIVSPLELDFGTILEGETATLPLTMTISNDIPVIIDSYTFEFPTGFSMDLTVPHTIQPEEQLVVDVTFAPTTAADYSSSLWIHSDAVNPTVTVSLQAIAIAPPISELVVSPLELDFGTIMEGETESLSLELSVDGSVPVTIDEATFEFPTGFSWDLALPYTLQTDDVIYVNVTFAPPSAADWTSSLWIDSDATNPVVTVDLIADATVNSVSEGGELMPTTLEVAGAYPNPFNATTVIKIRAPQGRTISAVIYDIRGREVHRYEAYRQSGSTTQLAFEADNLPSGLYICHVTDGVTSFSQKLVLLK
ncbi:MAG TPA: choice-of-anchor D domain-containing protein [Bacteroidetes bacterium]|nr:bacillopeptidase F precursor [bacterium BMS3Bbin04]HDO65272.1 choice-of-anchor D domain-containing protein [Bacteroidota bacterium]HEX04397.1 choice-of-anchor D domain-containing protein [Bacteroidota bacterium]